MEPTIFRYILRYSKAQQLWLLAVIALSYPFLYLSLEMPKLIVNRAIGDQTGPPYDIPVLGFTTFTVDIDQIDFLITLSLIYLLLVLINGALKYYINVFKGRLGERLLRRLRYHLYERILRFPLPHFRKVSQGELIPMITAEVEPLGGFVGTAFADPMFQGGQLIIILSFIMVQDPILGAAAIALYPFQIYAIPKLQRAVNQLGKQRVQNVRRLADHIGESVSGIAEIHANDAATLELSRFSGRLGAIYWIRYDIYRRKFFIKFLNNFIDKLTPFFFFSIGGYLVIDGLLSIGALVAVLAAYKDLAAPWKEMLTWYQQKEDARIKYEQVIEQFDPPGVLDEQRLLGDAESQPTDASVGVHSLSLVDEDGFRPLDRASLEIPDGAHLAIIGSGNSGKSELMLAMAGLVDPAGGSVRLGGKDLQELPRSVSGRRIAYVGSNAYLQGGSIWDALTYGLKYRPLRPADYDDREREQRAREVEEAAVAGNSVHNYDDDWIDYAAAGASNADDLRKRVVELLRDVELDADIYGFGLRGTVDPEADPEAAGKVLEARFAMRERLDDTQLAGMVEPFDAAHYNLNATVAENVLFGVPLGDAFREDRIAGHPYMQQVLERVGLSGDFLRMGERVAETMIELFADLPPGHEFFDQFSFISAEDLPDFQAVLGRAARGLDALNDEDRQRLTALPFKLIPARHRLDLIGESMQGRLLEARRSFASDPPAAVQAEVAFFDANAFTPGASIQDNILFGKTVYGQADAARRVEAAISEILDNMGMREIVMGVGLGAQTGGGGSRLSSTQRQKIALARALLKRPDVLLIDEAAAALDGRSQEIVLQSVLAGREGKTVVWSAGSPEIAARFDRVAVMEGGRVIEQGTYRELSERPDSVLAGLLGERSA